MSSYCSERKESTMTSSSSNNTISLVSKKGPALCSFCENANAAIIISGQLIEKPLCLLHYYTTRAVRSFPTNRIAPVGNELQLQLPHVQSIFSEAFVELQREISEEVAMQSLKPKADNSNRKNHTTKRTSDPLSMLLSSSMATNRNNNTKKLNKKFGSQGGFIPPIRIPERLQHPTYNNNPGSKTKGTKDYSPSLVLPDTTGTSATLYNPYKRRKQSNTSYWTLGDTSTKTTNVSTWSQIEKANQIKAICSFCGSSTVQTDVTGKNNDNMAKGETWGNKDRPDVIYRYTCLSCGKKWSEEG